MKVLIDTNMFLAPEKFKADIFSQLRNLGYLKIYTLSKVLEELKKISEKGGKSAKAAKIGLILIEKYDVRILESSGHVDKSLFSLSEEYAICTQDKDLIRRLTENRRRVLFLKQKKFLVEEF